MATVEVDEVFDPAADSAAVKLLARPMDGTIRLALTRNPSPLGSAELYDHPPRLILAREQERPLGMAMSWRRPAFLDGAEAEIGYLGQLRLARPAGRGPMTRGFALALAGADTVPITLTAIASDNRRARRLLERGAPGLPHYQPLGKIVSLVFPTRAHRAGHCRSADRDDREAILDLLAQQRLQFALAPRWRSEDLPPGGRCRDLDLRDFVVAGKGDLVEGACAVWDQRRFKQTLVVGYRRLLGLLRPIINILSRGVGLPALPAPGSAARLAFLSHFAAVDPRVALDLVRAACSAARARGLDWISLSLAAKDPLVPPLRRLPHRSYDTVLYAVGRYDATLGLRIGESFRLEGALL
jgi:hypothetical protein